MYIHTRTCANGPAHTYAKTSTQCPYGGRVRTAVGCGRNGVQEAPQTIKKLGPLYIIAGLEPAHTVAEPHLEGTLWQPCAINAHPTNVSECA
jgi:hypothetical protein